MLFGTDSDGYAERAAYERRLSHESTNPAVASIHSLIAEAYEAISGGDQSKLRTLGISAK
jgi:hypothetical protein